MDCAAGYIKRDRCGMVRMRENLSYKESPAYFHWWVRIW